ncbi:MAG: TIGR04282 family arsenosugar biosynthesis glycosyltransferase [Cyanobacteria bacterium J06600_6]
MTETLIIFSRYPEAGKTKTRMIPALGAAGAAELQRAMTEHTLKQAIALTSDRSTAIEIQFAGGNMELMQAWLGKDQQYQPQAAGDLGVKMRSALENAFAVGQQRVVIIGIDCPDLDSSILNRAFDSLFHHDLVLGVAEDGGYYLIGLNSPQPQLFDNITWGTELVLKQTKAIAEQLNLKVDYLTTLADVDRPEDLRIWQKYAKS